jgi:hypothetical protein
MADREVVVFEVASATSIYLSYLRKTGTSLEQTQNLKRTIESFFRTRGKGIFTL